MSEPTSERSRSLKRKAWAWCVAVFFVAVLSIVTGSACTGYVFDIFGADPIEEWSAPVAASLSDSPAFADERGSGVFIDSQQRIVRIESNGRVRVTQSHPRNPVAPGVPTSVWPLTTSTAAAATSTGIFVVDGVWLVAPAWQSLIPAEGLNQVLQDPSGTVWFAHEKGLYRLINGQVSEVKNEAGESIGPVFSLANGPTLSGGTGLWVARQARLDALIVNSFGGLVLVESSLKASALKGGVKAMAGVTSATDGEATLWVATDTRLFQLRDKNWAEYKITKAPKRMLPAGMSVWMLVDRDVMVWRLGDEQWSRINAPADALLAADAAGSAWIVGDDGVRVVAPSFPIWVTGVFENEVVETPDVPLEATVNVPVAKVRSLSWALDSAALQPIDAGIDVMADGGVAQSAFAPAGWDDGAVKSVSFSALKEGPHALRFSLELDDGTASTRVVRFTARIISSAPESWAMDIKPISEARCTKCHGGDIEPNLQTYQAWKTEADAILKVIRQGRMPADGPLDANSVRHITRWVTGERAP